MVKVKATKSFVGAISMRMNEERIVEPTKEMQELIACGHVVVLEDLSEDYKGVEIENMTKKQLVKYAKDNRIPIAEEASKEIVFTQINKFIGNGGQETEGKKNETK